MKDTLLLHEVPAWRLSRKRKPLTSSKYYFFEDLKSLNALAEEGKLKRFLCVSLEDRARQIGVIRVLPYRLFLDALWDREFTP